jgi:hypothetical protein
VRYKYTLIISQFYYSRHYFIVKHDKHFMENAKKFALELMKHKRFIDTEREFYIGDLEAESKKIRQRYNINDQGDIYFIQSYYANYCMTVTWMYLEDTRRESRGFQKKAVVERISKHHSYIDVKKIVEKHFKIA